MNTKKLTTIFIFCISSFLLFAQQSTVTIAILYFKDGELDKAKSAIDEACVHEKTSSKAKTWFYKGDIYMDIYTSENPAYKNLADNPGEIALQAYKKSIELDGSGGDYAENSKDHLINLAKNAVYVGAAQYQNADYSKALISFILAQKINPKDTNAYLYGAYAAEELKDYKKAKSFYIHLKDNINYKGADVYINLARIFENADNDNEKALQIIKEGRVSQPDNGDLMAAEAHLYQVTGKIDEAIMNLEKLVQKEPTNTDFLINLASFYDTKGETNKAIEYYKKAINIKPNDLDANYSLAVMFYNKGAEIYEKTMDMDLAQYQREGMQLENKANGYFKQSIPYFEKSHNIDPKDKTTLNNLKMIYNSLNMKSDEMRIDQALKNAGN